MIFRRKKGRDVPDEDEDQEEEIEYVLFQGALNGQEANLQANARLAQAGLVPAKEMVTDGLLRRAHMIRLEPKGQVAGVTVVVDGVPYPGGRMPAKRALAITQMLKLLAGLDIKVRNKPQSGGIKAEFQETPYELHVDSTPLKGGAERLVVRTQNLKETLEKADDVGLTDEFREKIRELGARKQGLMLVCGPPYSGTTTTTYVVLRTIDAYIYSIYSIADTTGHDLFGITEQERKDGEDLEAALMRMIRAEADVVFLDPLRDAETAKTIFKMQEKVAMLTEFAARDTAHGVLQLIQWMGDPKLVAGGLSGIVSQKLLRKLCEKCKEAYRPNPKLVAKVGLPPETKVLYRPPRPPTPEEQEEAEEEYRPCRQCGGIGYFGRMGMYELLEMTEPMRELVASGPKDPTAIKALARKEKMLTLQRDGLRLVVEGKTTLEELQRVFKSG